MKHPLKIDGDEKNFPVDKLLSSAQKIMKSLGMPAIDFQKLTKGDDTTSQIQNIGKNLGIEGLEKSSETELTQEKLLQLSQSMMKNLPNMFSKLSQNNA
jgi:hypothetical protein